MSARRTLTAVAAVACLSAGCGGDVRPNDDLTVLGDNARAGDIEVLNVHVEAPPDGRYSPGEDVVVRFTMVNNGDRPDELLRAEVPGSKDTTVHWDKECDGTAEAVEAIPLPPGTTGVDVGPPGERGHQPYHVTVTGLQDLARAGTTLPMTFTFAQAGTIGVEALVAAEKPRPVEAERACSAE
jgi:copper(I)-binding protein